MILRQRHLHQLSDTAQLAETMEMLEADPNIVSSVFKKLARIKEPPEWRRRRLLALSRRLEEEAIVATPKSYESC